MVLDGTMKPSLLDASYPYREEEFILELRHVHHASQTVRVDLKAILWDVMGMKWHPARRVCGVYIAWAFQKEMDVKNERWLVEEPNSQIWLLILNQGLTWMLEVKRNLVSDVFKHSDRRIMKDVELCESLKELL